MELDYLDRPQTIKLCLVGDTNVGKSSLAIRFAENKFDDNIPETIGSSFLLKEIFMNGIRLRYNIWDTAGMERYRSLAPLYYRDAPVIFVVYDVGDEKSFYEIPKYWMKEVSGKSRDDVICVLVENKCDLEEEWRQVPRGRGQAYADSIGALFFEVSAKTSENVEEMFLEVTQHLLSKTETSRLNTSTIQLDYNTQNRTSFWRKVKNTFGKRCKTS